MRASLDRNYTIMFVSDYKFSKNLLSREEKIINFKHVLKEKRLFLILKRNMFLIIYHLNCNFYIISNKNINGASTSKPIGRHNYLWALIQAWQYNAIHQ